MPIELVKMSPKGQLVVPQNMRKLAGLEAGDRFIPFSIQGGILFKKIALPSMQEEFNNLATEMRSQFEKQGIKEADVEEAIKWARKK